MRRIECDCCGADGATSAITIRFPVNGGKCQRTYDLCEQCRDMLDDFLHNAYMNKHTDRRGTGGRDRQGGGKTHE